MKKGKDSRDLRRALNVDNIDSRCLYVCSEIRNSLVSDPIRLGLKLENMSLQNMLRNDPRLQRSSPATIRPLTVLNRISDSGEALNTPIILFEGVDK